MFALGKMLLVFHQRPLLSYREQSRPTKQSGNQCTLCHSRESSGRTESCGAINTESNDFYVLVDAADDYTNAVLSFTGNNLLMVKRVGLVPK